MASRKLRLTTHAHLKPFLYAYTLIDLFSHWRPVAALAAGNENGSHEDSMKQASLFDGYAALAGTIPAIKAAMREAAKAPVCDGRKALPDMMNELAVLAGVKLTKGNAASFSKATLDKMLSPSDTSHPPSILALLAFCAAARNAEPLRVMLRSVGMDIMTEEDRKLAEYARTLIRQKKMKKQLRKLEDEL